MEALIFGRYIEESPQVIYDPLDHTLECGFLGNLSVIIVDILEYHDLGLYLRDLIFLGPPSIVVQYLKNTIPYTSGGFAIDAVYVMMYIFWISCNALLHKLRIFQYLV